MINYNIISVVEEKKYGECRCTISDPKSIPNNVCRIAMFLYVFRCLRKKIFIHIFDRHRIKYSSNTAPINYTYTY